MWRGLMCALLCPRPSRRAARRVSTGYSDRVRGAGIYAAEGRGSGPGGVGAHRSAALARLAGNRRSWRRGARWGQGGAAASGSIRAMSAGVGGRAGRRIRRRLALVLWGLKHLAIILTRHQLTVCRMTRSRRCDPLCGVHRPDGPDRDGPVEKAMPGIPGLPALWGGVIKSCRIPVCLRGRVCTWHVIV